MTRTNEQLEMLYAKFDDDMKTKPKPMRIALALDQLGNVIFLNGSMDETMSSHIHRKQVASGLPNSGGGGIGGTSPCSNGANGLSNSGTSGGAGGKGKVIVYW